MTAAPCALPASPPSTDPSHVPLWRRLLSFPAAIMALLLAMIFARARYDIADPDIWWHLRNAAHLFAGGMLRADAFSFTVAGLPWINTEWLAEVPYYLAWRIAGLPGVEWCSMLLLGLIALAVWYVAWRASGNAKASLAACLVAMLFAMVSFGPRTILAGYLLLCALLAVLQAYRRRGHAPLWLLPLLFCLWANTHGSWSLGLVVFALVIAGGVPRRGFGAVMATPWRAAQLRALLVSFAASLAALFLNPYGYRLVLYPLDMAFRQKLNIAHVEEWGSLDFHTPRGKLVLLILAALLLTALARRFRPTVTELALLLFGLYSGLTYIRFLFLAGILMAPLLARLCDGLPAYRPEIDKPLLNGAIIATVIAGCVWAHPTAARTELVVAKTYPAAFAAYSRVHPTAGPVLNFYLWGGYLGWRDPAYKDFVDSRVDLFEYAGVFKDYLDLLGMKEPESILDRYGIRSVLFPPDEPLSHALRRDPRWRVAYADPVAMLFERTGATPAPSWKPPARAARPW